MLDLRSISSIRISSIIASCISIVCFLLPIDGEEIRFIANDAIILEKPKIGFDWVQNYFNSISPETTPEEIVDFLISLRMTLAGLGYSTPTLQQLCERLLNSFNEKRDEKALEILSDIYTIIIEKESAISSMSTLTLSNQRLQPNFLLVKNHKKVFKENTMLRDSLHAGAEKLNIPIRQYLDLVIEKLKSSQSNAEKDEKRLLKYAINLRKYLDHPNEYAVVFTSCGGMEDKGAIALSEILAGALLMVIPYPPVQVIGGAMVTHGITTLADLGGNMPGPNQKKSDSGESGNSP